MATKTNQGSSTLSDALNSILNECGAEKTTRLRLINSENNSIRRGMQKAAKMTAAKKIRFTHSDWIFIVKIINTVFDNAGMALDKKQIVFKRFNASAFDDETLYMVDEVKLGILGADCVIFGVEVRRSSTAG